MEELKQPHSYLVTGGCGLQGSSIVEALLPFLHTVPGTSITVISRNPHTNLFPGVAYEACDVNSSTSVEEIMARIRPNVVFHCAGIMTVARGALSDEVVRRINVGGTRVMLDAARRCGTVRAFVFTSSSSVVQRGGIVDQNGLDETASTVVTADGIDIYPTTKAEAERLVLAADDAYNGFRTAALRPAAIYGERDNDLTPALVGPSSSRESRAKIQVGNGKNLFSFTYVGNSTKAHLLAADRLLSANPAVVGPVAGEAFFVSNGDPVPFWIFRRTAMRAAGVKIREEDVRKIPLAVAFLAAWVLEWAAWFRGSQPTLTRMLVRFSTLNRWFRVDKAKKVLGYEPEVAWDEGIQRAVRDRKSVV